MRRKLIIIFTAMGMLYTLGYPIVRWRKFIVMHEHHAKEQGLLVRETGLGWDVRDSWKGKLKNRLNPLVFFCYRPMCSLEDYLRGFSSPYMKPDMAMEQISSPTVRFPRIPEGCCDNSPAL